MDLEERLLEAIQKGKRERAQEVDGDRAFEAKWEELTETVIKPACRTAQRLFDRESIRAEAAPDNGGYQLKAVWRGPRSDTGSYLYKLKFRADKAQRKIVIESPFKDQPEPFDADVLAEAVDSALEGFVYAAARQSPAKAVAREAGASGLGV